jgi:hypothetical protein
MGQPLIVIVGGIHPPGLTTNLLLARAADPVLGQMSLLTLSSQSPTTSLSARCLRHRIDQYWNCTQVGSTAAPDLLIWAFSAGCVGAVSLACHWQRHRGKVLALFAVDGWGVPMPNAFPTYRLSHDRFTHTTSHWAGGGTAAFWAEPSVPHLEFWQNLPTIEGWQISLNPGRQGQNQRLTAGEFLFQWSCGHLMEG